MYVRSMITSPLPHQKDFQVVIAHTPEYVLLVPGLALHRQSGMPRGFGLVYVCCSVGLRDFSWIGHIGPCPSMGNS